MPVIDVDFAEADVAPRLFHGIDHFLGLGRGVQPVGGKRDHEEFRLRLRKGLDQGSAAFLGSQVEIVRALGDVQIRIGVEALDEFFPLVEEIAFDLEIRREIELEGGVLL